MLDNLPSDLVWITNPIGERQLISRWTGQVFQTYRYINTNSTADEEILI